jgi:hypothetical protein
MVGFVWRHEVQVPLVQHGRGRPVAECALWMSLEPMLHSCLKNGNEVFSNPRRYVGKNFCIGKIHHT